MRLYKTLLISSLLLMLVILPSSAQQSRNIENPTLWQDFTYDFENMFRSMAYAYSRPLHWKKNNFLKFGGTIGATGLIHLFDTDIRDGLLSHEEDLPNIIREYGWRSGSPQVNYGATGALYLTGLFTKNEKLRRMGVLLIGSANATGFLQQVSKSVAGRARPGAGFGKSHFRPFSFGGDVRFRSFPSGHAVLTFTNAHAIAKQFNNKWVKAGIYAIGLTPGITRIYADAHWASDVFLSWAMSYFMVEAIDLYLDRKYDKKYNSKSSVINSLGLSFGAGGIGVSYTFN